MFVERISDSRSKSPRFQNAFAVCTVLWYNLFFLEWFRRLCACTQSQLIEWWCELIQIQLIEENRSNFFVSLEKNCYQLPLFRTTNHTRLFWDVLSTELTVISIFCADNRFPVGGVITFISNSHTFLKSIWLHFVYMCVRFFFGNNEKCLSKLFICRWPPQHKNNNNKLTLEKTEWDHELMFVPLKFTQPKRRSEKNAQHVCLYWDRYIQWHQSHLLWKRQFHFTHAIIGKCWNMCCNLIGGEFKYDFYSQHFVSFFLFVHMCRHIFIQTTQKSARNCLNKRMT